MPADRRTRYTVRLFVDWLNKRFDAGFELPGPSPEAAPAAPDEIFVASDGERRLALYLAPIWEPDEAWDGRLGALEGRLDAGGPDGSFLLWVPPEANLPSEEPDASDFVERVQNAAAPLPAGARTEVMFPVPVKFGKTREEGGYASVVGGMNRWWTRITEKVNGTFHVDSSAVHRLTLDGEAREKLWDMMGRLSLSIGLGQAVDFEVDEAWTLQRLPDSREEAGFAIAGAPAGIDPTDGILVRRTVRKRLQAANEALDALGTDLRAVGLLGSYEYAELESAGAMVKALAPDLFSRLQIVSILADGEVCPTFLPRSLS